MSIPVKKRSLLLLFGSPHGQGFTRRLAEAYYFSTSCGYTTDGSAVGRTGGVGSLP